MPVKLSRFPARRMTLKRVAIGGKFILASDLNQRRLVIYTKLAIRTAGITTPDDYSLATDNNGVYVFFDSLWVYPVNS